MTAHLDLAIFDAADIVKVGSFYAALTGWDVVRKDADRFGIRTPDGQEVEFQHAPDHIPPRWPDPLHPQQFHLDLQTDNPQALAACALTLGATHLADGPAWITLADPAGHPFDLCQSEDVGPVLRLFAVTIDAPDASALAHFYAALTGMDLTYDGPEGAFITGSGKNLMFQQIPTYAPPRWPDPRHPQQAHLDLRVDNLNTASTHALSLGASVLDTSADRYQVLADPAGHPFCLVNG